MLHSRETLPKGLSVPSSSQGTPLQLQTHTPSSHSCQIPLPGVPLLLPHLCSCCNSTDFPCNTLQLPQTAPELPIELSHIFNYRDSENKRGILPTWSFSLLPQGSAGFMQSFRLSVVLCLILFLVSGDLPSCLLQCWC